MHASPSERSSPRLRQSSLQKPSRDRCSQGAGTATPDWGGPGFKSRSLRVSSLWPSSVCPRRYRDITQVRTCRFLTHTFQFNTVTVSDTNSLNAELFSAMAHGMDTTWNSAVVCLCDSVYKGRHVYMAFVCILQIADDALFKLAVRCVFCISVFGSIVISLEKLLQDAKYWRDYLVPKNYDLFNRILRRTRLCL